MDPTWLPVTGIAQILLVQGQKSQSLLLMDFFLHSNYTQKTIRFAISFWTNLYVECEKKSALKNVLN